MLVLPDRRTIAEGSSETINSLVPACSFDPRDTCAGVLGSQKLMDERLEFLLTEVSELLF
jgi:hypothetical protein